MSEEARTEERGKAADNVGQTECSEREADNADKTVKADKADTKTGKHENAGKKTKAKETPEIEADTEARAKAEADKKESDAVAQEKDRYMRLMAEFQNYKKRVANEKSDIHAYANEKIITELVEVLDNFERALENDPASDSEAYAKGMSMIFDQMKTVLVKAGLEEVEALGVEFDPTVHNAVMTEDSEEYESGKVSKVLQKGYTLNKKVIRPAMVTVTK